MSVSDSLCVICVRHTRNEKESLEDQLTVVFFLLKFFNYSVLNCNNSLKLSKNTLPKDELADEEIISSLLPQGNPSEWLKFCSGCQNLLKEGQYLYKRLTEIGSKLDMVRSKVETKVRNSFNFKNQNGEDFGTVFQTVRKSFRLQLETGVQSRNFEPVEVIKVEPDWMNYDPEGMSPAACDNNEDFGVEDIVIYPTDTPEPDFSHSRTLRSKQSRSYQLDDDNDDLNAQNESDGGTDDSWVDSDKDQEGNVETINDFKETKVSSRKTPTEARTCPVCHVVFDKPSIMARHFKSKHDRRIRAQCPLCKKGFVREDYLKSHQSTCPGNSATAVDTGNLPDTNTNNVNLLRLQEEELVETADNWTAENPPSPTTILNHPMFSQNSKPGPRKSSVTLRTCPVCLRIFDRPSKLTKHLSTAHNNKGKYSCSICSAKFLRQDSYDKHFMEVHQDDQDVEINQKNQDQGHVEHVEVKVEGGGESEVVEEDQGQGNQDQFDPDLDPENSGDNYNPEESDSDLDLSDPEYEPEPKKSKKNTKKSRISRQSRCGPLKSPLTSRTCPICHRIFDKPSRMTYHLSSHRKGQFNCSICRMKFNRKDFFSLHMKTHSAPSLEEYDTTDADIVPPPKPRSTPKEKKNGPSKSPLHLRTCPICSKIFNRPSVLKHHIEVRHIKDPQHKCEICGKAFVHKYYLKDHMWSHYTAEEKLLKLRERRTLKQQQQKGRPDVIEVSKEQSRTCPHCHEIFVSPSKMQQHLNAKHERKVLFRCDVCKNGFLRKDSLEVHLRTHLTPEQREELMRGNSVTIIVPGHPRSEDNVASTSTNATTGSITINPHAECKPSTLSKRTCPTCGKIFDKISRMLRHLESVHEKKETFVCDICGQKFSWKVCLTRHIRFHEKDKTRPGVKDYLCSECGIGFKHKSSFNRHNTLKHNDSTNFNEFPCDQCDRAFPILSQLNMHKKKHLKETQDSGSGDNEDMGYRNLQNSQIPRISTISE